MAATRNRRARARLRAASVASLKREVVMKETFGPAPGCVDLAPLALTTEHVGSTAASAPVDLPAPPRVTMCRSR
jgi:hypothetical protein